jgi:hypothetical protein
METPQRQLACTLEGPDLVDRIEAWREIAARATTRRVEDGRVVAVYPKDPQIHVRLRELIDAEAECCAFLRFDVDETPDAIVTELRLPDDLADSTRTRIVALFGD